jgi:ABC-2 type transport system permease protein
MNIFIRELRSNFRSLVIWGVIVILFVVGGISEFSGYEGNPEMLAVLDQMPPAMLEAFNMNAFNLTTISGFFGVMFTYYALIASISAAMWGSDIISKEERDKTVEFSLTLPVTRSRVVTAKTLAALVNCVGLLLIIWGISLVSAEQYQPDGEFYAFLRLTMVAVFFMQLIFLSVGIFLGCAMKQYKRASSVAVALLLGTYFLSVISGLPENLEFLKYFSPFNYFDAGMLLRESKFDPTFLAISAGIIVLSMVGAYLTYSRRDLYI